MKITAIYTGQGLCDPLSALLKKELPGLSLTNIIDDSIIADVVAAGGVTKAVTKRLIGYYAVAEEHGADYILNTCSSVGEVVELGERQITTPIVRIDLPMAQKAVKNFGRIAVIATLPTTLEPTMRLIRSEAERQGRSVTVLNGLAAGAYQALVAGDPQGHDAAIERAALALADRADCFVLAQGSMMRMQDKLSALTGKTVLSSPVCCVEYLKTLA